MDWSEAAPVIAATYGLLNEDDTTTQEAVIAVLKRPAGDDRTIRALAHLYKFNFINGPTIEERPVPILIEPTEKGLQQTSGWPKPGAAGEEQVAQLLAALDERIESDETPEEEKSNLRRIREGVVGASRDILVGVLTSYASRATGVE